MSDFEYQSDPRLPSNVTVVHTDDQREKYALEHGTFTDSEKRGASVTDMKPDHDDDSVTNIEYNFVYRSGIYVHFLTTLHRHEDGPDTTGYGNCEDLHPDDHPAPHEVREVMTDYFDAPVAGPEGDDE